MPARLKAAQPLPKPLETKLATRRLRLEPLGAADAASIQRSFPRWNIVQYMSVDGIPWPYPSNGAQQFVSFAESKMQEGTDYLWGIHLKTRNKRWLIGVVHLRTTDPRDHIGFWLAEAHWGNGYMREAVKAVTNFAFKKLGMPSLRIMNAEQNTGSRNISLALGAKFVGKIPMQSFCGKTFDEIWELKAP